MEGNTKCFHLKNRPVKGLCGSCLSVWGPEPPTHCIPVYSILIHTGKGVGGRVEPERRLERQQLTKLGRKIPTWLTVSPVCKTNTFRKVPLQVSSVRRRHFSSLSMWLISPWYASKGRVEWWKLRSWIAGLETKRIEEDLRRDCLCTSHLMCTQRNLAPLLPQHLNLSQFPSAYPCTEPNNDNLWVFSPKTSTVNNEFFLFGWVLIQAYKS